MKKNKKEASHNVISHWLKYMFSKCHPYGPNGTLVIPKNIELDWKNMMNSSYDKLDKDSKNISDSAADMYLKDL
jgi:hypothetical protein